MDKKKKIISLAVVLLLVLAAALALRGLNAGKRKKTSSVSQDIVETVADTGYFTVKRLTGEAWYPDEDKWTYHFTYACPAVEGSTYTAALINDTYQMALKETRDIALPMFAASPDMQWDGHNEVAHDFTVKCNTERLLSILQRQRQTRGELGPSMQLEAQTFNVYGDTAGDVMTLRGAALILAGADPENLEAVTAADLPDYPGLVGGSSDEMEEALLPVLFAEFEKLQAAGVVRENADRDDYEIAFAPSRDFYVSAEGKIVFFFPPSLLEKPSFDVPEFSFTPAEIEALL